MDRTQGGASTVEAVDTQDMVIVHRMFRREFAVLPALIGSVGDGDTTRAEETGGHARELLDVLHYHHAGEDEFLWPVLLERARPSTELIRRMQHQHEYVAEAVQSVHDVLPSWRTSAERAIREQVTDKLEALNLRLVEHLEQEEAEILPLAAQHLTTAEWNLLGDHSMAAIPKKRLMVLFGYVLEELTPAERKHMISHMPIPARALYRLVGQRKWRQESTSCRSGIRPCLPPAR
jgi:hypothetical protein